MPNNPSIKVIIDTNLDYRFWIADFGFWQGDHALEGEGRSPLFVGGEH
ncbi:MAG: hypothetical protein VKJ64_19225 [Leptolyngbyaceae bacterium]|nr:hypothetical protein [Leptolyngbyaceae bacterium]